MILVCGEALIDLFVEIDATSPPARPMPARAVPGGSPMNVAIGLARLGVAAGFFGALSRDAFGARLAALLDAEGVALDLAPRLERRTTLSVIARQPDGQPRYSFYGEGAADRSLDVSHLPAALPQAVTALAFGSYTLAVDPVGAAYLELARRAGSERVVSVDANLRPGVTPDRDAWRARFHNFVACAAIVKASDEDVAGAYGTEADIDRIAADWLVRGARLVVVTRGAHGAVAFTKDRRVALPGRPTRVIDTVGAGDTVHAALLARLSQRGALTREALGALDEAALADLLAYANTAASITCARQGADLPRAAEVEAAL